MWQAAPMGEMITTIRAAADVDARWLTEVLHRAGIGRGHEVTSFEATSIGTGQVGENVRFELEWSPPGAASAGLPSSVVGKFPSPSPLSRATAVQVGTYQREVGFYRDLRPHVEIPTPTVHHIGWDGATHDFVLVMDDVRSAVQGDQIAGCRPEQALAVVTEVVGLHAPTWGSTERWTHLDWLHPPDRERTAVLAMMYASTLPGFVDRYRATVGDDVIRVAERVVDRFGVLADQLAEWAGAAGGWCVVHADYRLDNLLFADRAATDATGTVTVVDWQTTSFGIGPADVAYFLGSGLLPADRERVERELVGDYGASLRGRGVAVDDELLWDGYVLGSASGLLMAIIASQIVEQTQRGDAMFAVMAERHTAQIEHVGLLDRL